MDATHGDDLACLTAGEPGIGGLLKQQPEDFIVEELPACEPADSGEFLYLLVEKRNRLTTDVVRHFSRHFKSPWSAIGFAGLKDKRSISRQWFSVERGREEIAESFSDPAITILQMTRHHRPLRRGTLRGNRFQIKVRQVRIEHVLPARRILSHLAQRGAPNFIGPQRFGYRGDYHLLGARLILGDERGFLDGLLGGPRPRDSPREQQARRLYDQGLYEQALDAWSTAHRPERQALGPLSRKAPIGDAVHGIDLTHRMLTISAFQSAIFNRLLDQRVRAGDFDRLRPGDLALAHGTYEFLRVGDPAALRGACERFELSPTGPMWGTDMPRADGEVAERELAALAEAGLDEAGLAASSYRIEGARRSLRMTIGHPDIRAGSDDKGPYVYVSFELPRGCFATTVMREIMKQPAGRDAG
jgi:tRNA pseudouridine13 synthase